MFLSNLSIPDMLLCKKIKAKRTAITGCHSQRPKVGNAAYHLALDDNIIGNTYFTVKLQYRLFWTTVDLNIKVRKILNGRSFDSEMICMESVKLNVKCGKNMGILNGGSILI